MISVYLLLDFLWRQRCGAAEIKTIIVIRCFAQSRQQQTDRMKAPFNSFLRIVSESGTRRDRIWDETRANLGRGTTERGAAFADRHRSRIGGLPCLQTNGLCKIRQAPTSFTNSKYPQILNSLPYIAIRPARDAYSFFVD